jgi:hypothetical protein
MSQIPMMRSSLGIEDLTQLWLIGPTRSFSFWPGIQAYIRSKTGFQRTGGTRTRTQHNILIKSLEKVARDSEGEDKGWKKKLIIFWEAHVDQ